MSGDRSRPKYPLHISKDDPPHANPCSFHSGKHYADSSPDSMYQASAFCGDGISLPPLFTNFTKETAQTLLSL